MLSRLRLLQSKYSLSDEFIYNAIDSEIKRQAMLDINGAINNCSVAMLQDMMTSFSPAKINGMEIEKIIVDDPLVNAIATECLNGNVSIDEATDKVTAPDVPELKVSNRRGKKRG